MFKISPAVRISFGLVMFTLSVILIADLFGIIPKKDLIVLDARKKVCEVLAVQLSVAVSKSEFDIVKTSLELFVERNNDVIAASMSKTNGDVIAEFGEFIDYDVSNLVTEEEQSSGNIVIVPIFSGANRWGSVNVEFGSIYSDGIYSALTGSILGMLLFVALGCFVGYMFILRKALKVLDPKAVVPDRVRKAFNTLSEGVLIVDKKDQIIMANDAFAEKLNEDPNDLLGSKASSFKWKHISRELRESGTKMPWVSAIKEGVNHVGVSLKLSTPGSGVRALSTNCAPITDDNGNTRGALVTFDDITEVQETNVLLENAVTSLTKNETEIKRKNIELELLATRDSLTGCYNRRAFFDLFEKALEDANRHNRALSCIMIDIDHFKLVNDNFGHTIGDEAIRMVTDVLNNHLSNKDGIVGRYGGEEFCVVLPGSDIDEAVGIAEHYRQSIQSVSKGFCVEDVSITASFGVTSNTDKAADSSDLLENSDKALYAAKESGRNKVIKWCQDGTVISVSDDVVINLNDRQISDSDGSTNDKEKVSLLQRKVEDLQSKLHQSVNTDGDEETRSIDPITKLPSKSIFMDRVGQSMAYSLRSDKLMAVVMLNVDMFSRINDTMGRDVGNEFLREIGHRLKGVLRHSDTVASMLSLGQSSPLFSRLKDDEFALLLPGIVDLEALAYVIKRIQNKFEGNIEVSGNEVYLTTSIGVALHPQDGDTPDLLIDNSRRARKQAKTLAGRNNYQFFSDVDNRVIMDQMRSEIELRNAIDHNQFVLYYQPKLNLKKDSIDSVEALIRWQHPTRAMVPPNDFIPVAEKTGMILEIGKWCLQSACKQTKLWVDMGAKNIRTSVNVSAIEFSNNDFKHNVLSTLKESGLDAKHLEIEITESTIIADQEIAHKLIDELRFIGVTITLDDFGTGYSSLSYFGSLDLDWLKLDRSFLLQAMNNYRSRNIYSSIVKMVHATGVKVVSEGVETEEQFAFISDLNIDEVQGYLIAKPGDADSVTSILFPDLNKKYSS
jgi:diguanylate cyclase (GGDEF)-like protein